MVLIRIELEYLYYEIKYLIMINPPTNNTINKIERILKYFSIKSLIGSPKIFINKATIKNLQLLLINEAIINMIRFILNVPAEIVINLNGIGVKPAVNTIQKSQLLYKILILLKPSTVMPGTY